MKNNITTLILFLILLANSLNAQIISLDQFYYFQTHKHQENLSLPDNLTEIRDLNNILQPYVGVWRGSISNQRTLEIHTSVATVTTFDNVLIDRLLSRYKITDANNNVLYETLSITDNDHINVILSRFADPIGDMISFYAEPGVCGRVNDLHYKIIPAVEGISPAKLEVISSRTSGAFPRESAPCNGSYAAAPIPMSQLIVLTK